MRAPSRRRGLQGLAAAAFATAAVLALLPATGQADEPTVVGWWYRDLPLTADPSQAAAVSGQAAGRPVLADLADPISGPSQVPPVTLPPPPVLPPVPLPTIPPDVTIPDPGVDVPTPIPVPAGGLLVANDATGMRGIAAMRFEAPGAGGGVVTLEIAPGSTPSPPINACPALSDWLPGPDQPWSARPAHDCDRISVTGTLSVDGAMMIWELPDTFREADGATYDVLLVPDRSDGTPYQVLFEKPGSDAFTVTSPFPDETVPPDLPLPGDLPPAAGTFSPDGFELPLDPVLPTIPPEEVPTAPTGQSGPLNQLADVLENPTVRRIAAALLVALGAYAYWQSGRAEQRAPRLLGALGGPAAGAVEVLPPAFARHRGIGRFARDRTKPPPRL